MPMRASADAKDAMMAVGSLRRCFYSDGESDILFLQFCSSFRTLAERGIAMNTINLICQLIGVTARVVSAVFSVKSYFKHNKKK